MATVILQPLPHLVATILVCETPCFCAQCTFIGPQPLEHLEVTICSRGVAYVCNPTNHSHWSSPIWVSQDGHFEPHCCMSFCTNHSHWPATTGAPRGDHIQLRGRMPLRPNYSHCPSTIGAPRGDHVELRLIQLHYSSVCGCIVFYARCCKENVSLLCRRIFCRLQRPYTSCEFPWWTQLRTSYVDLPWYVHGEQPLLPLLHLLPNVLGSDRACYKAIHVTLSLSLSLNLHLKLDIHNPSQTPRNSAAARHFCR